MSSLARLIFLILGLFLIFLSLGSLLDIVAGAESIGGTPFPSPTAFSYLVTETPIVAVDPSTATVAAAFTQAAIPILTIIPTSTALPNSTVAPPVTSTPTVPSSTIVLGSHVVRPGEYLYCIGRAYQVTPQAIADFNSFSPETPLSVGQVLLIPNVVWANIPPGPICEAQFESPYSLTPSLTPTGITGLFQGRRDHIVGFESLLISFGGPNDILIQSRLQATPALANATSVPVQELRTVYIEWPIELHLGESDIVILTFNPGTGQTTIATPTEPGQTSAELTSTPNPFRKTDSSDPINISFRFDEYRIFAIARLDAAGFDYSPTEDVQKEITFGKKLEWRWSIKPKDPLTQQLVVSLRLHFEPAAGKVLPPDEDIWNQSYEVVVTKNLMASLFGTQTGFVAGFGVVLGLVLTSFSVGKETYAGLLWIGQRIRLEKKSPP